MFSRIISFFKKDTSLDEKIERALDSIEVEQLRIKVGELEASNERLERELADEKVRGTFPLIDVNIGDPSPIDSKERALYVAQVAGLHKEIIEPKLKQMISNIHQMLGEATNDREYDQALKGALYFAWELIRWGNMMVGEQIANQTQTAPGSSEEPIT